MAGVVNQSVAEYAAFSSSRLVSFLGRLALWRSRFIRGEPDLVFHRPWNDPAEAGFGPLAGIRTHSAASRSRACSSCRILSQRLEPFPGGSAVLAIREAVGAIKLQLSRFAAEQLLPGRFSREPQ